MLPLLLAMLQGLSVASGPSTPPDTLLPAADSAAVATAYLDDDARELVRLARSHRGQIDASVFRYTATSRQSISLGLRAVRRDRVIYRREVASLLDWRRDGPSRIEVVGAQEAIPIALPGVRVPSDLEFSAHALMPRPGDDRLFVNPTGNGFAWHPLIEGGEALYRYATGDSTEIRLPDGRTVRLAELRVTPRQRDVRLVTGSFWIELEAHGIVQAVFRPSRDFDLERDAALMDPEDASDVDEVPRFLKPLRFDIRYITVEYGLWEMRWWMPRHMAFEGSLQMGVARFPISLEMAISDYTVEADRYGLPELPPVTLRLAGDTYGRPRTHRFPTRIVIADTAALLSSPLLPHSLHSVNQRLITEREMRDLLERVGALPPAPWEVARPAVTWPWDAPGGLLRYNRVEGLSTGARLDWDLGRAHLDLTARLGTGDLEPNVELGVAVPTFLRDWRAAAYHRLSAADPEARPFGAGNSLNALVLGRDEGLYFRATGAELEVRPASGGLRYHARAYVERQTSVDPATDFSFRHILDDRHRFQPNLLAEAADQIGLAVMARAGRALDPGALRWGARVDATAETGTFTFLRPGVTLMAGAPLPGRLIAAAELGAGTTLGPDADRESVSPAQSRWLIGGPRTLRGLGAGALTGPDHLRGRLELANQLPAARLVLFSDLGWAGSFDAYRTTDLVVSAGGGASLLDGLVRLDLARAMRPTGDWRLHLYLDALF
jgi:hypothetical protein